MITFYNRSNQATKEQNLADFETLQKMRNGLIGEIHAVMQYDDNIHSSNDRVAIETWQNIKQEELVHIGELLANLNQLDPSQQQFVQQGIDEFDDRMKS